MKVCNLRSDNNNPVPNQFYINHEGKEYFQSYNSICAIYDKSEDKLTLCADWDYSRTTLKYLYKWIYDVCWHVWGRVDQCCPIYKSKRERLQMAINKGIISYNGGIR